MAETETTNRGFALFRFEDANGVPCTMQASSLATDEAIWLGAEEIGLKHFIAGRGWEDVLTPHSIADHFIANNRMHLTREQVAWLLPPLQHFADTGEVIAPPEGPHNG